MVVGLGGWRVQAAAADALVGHGPDPVGHGVPAARLAATRGSKTNRSPATATGRPTSLAPARARAGRRRPRPGATIAMAANIIEG